MNQAIAEPINGFTPEQKEYLAGFLEGIARRNSALSGSSGNAGESPTRPSREETIFGTPLGDVTKQELWKHEEHPLDGWDRILGHAEADKLPNEEDTYRFRNF